MLLTIALIVLGLAFGGLSLVVVAGIIIDHLTDYFERKKRQKKVKKNEFYCVDCRYLAKEYIIDKSLLKCAVNPMGDCRTCPDYTKENHDFT